MNGIGGSKDIEESKRWFKLAADQGYTNPQSALSSNPSAAEEKREQNVIETELDKKLITQEKTQKQTYVTNQELNHFSLLTGMNHHQLERKMMTSKLMEKECLNQPQAKKLRLDNPSSTIFFP